MTIPEHFIQLDKYVFVQGLDDFSSWWFLTRFQFCFSDKCTFLMLLWFFVLCQTINFIACTTSYKHTIRRENIQEHWISQIFYSSYCWCWIFKGSKTYL
jgi:hypothetical protein